ncbi:MAG TPA: histidine kinase dimerization/phospho-acceptor domain-containing protein, partial [Pyrinomonadaceae bacterium]|nr:histidine kinase dimerization/phospho-acceptor domain-containing protein [Pyrinomonadaceae bacterium]
MAKETENNHLENRVLVLMPTGRDAALVCATLGKAEIKAEPCTDTDELTEKINSGAGAILLAEEALKKETVERLSELFNEQPLWSDLPIVLFAGNAQNAEKLAATVGAQFNATIVERPIRIPILVSTVRGALRARERQYQSRDLLHQLEESDRQKDLFLATLSHELRTPLNSILGWIQMLNHEESRKRVDEKHALTVIERNARAQSEMISDILFVSRIITGKLKLNLKPTDIVPVVQAAIDILRPALNA